MQAVGLGGVGHRGAVVDPVEDAVAVLIDGGHVDAKLDAQLAVQCQRGELGLVHGAVLALVAHDLQVGEAEFAQAAALGRDEDPRAVQGRGGQVRVVGLPAGIEVPVVVRVAVVVVGVAGMALDVYPDALALGARGTGEGRQGADRGARRGDLVDAYGGRGVVDDAAEVRRGRHHGRQEDEALRAVVVKLVEDLGLTHAAGRGRRRGGRTAASGDERDERAGRLDPGYPGWT